MAVVPATFTVSPEDPGLRLDQLLMRRAGLSRRQARLCISLGRVRVDGRTARIIARRSPVGAAVDWQLPTELAGPQAGGRQNSDATPSAGGRSSAGGLPRPALQIVHLDRDLVVVNKPAGLLSEPDRFGSPSVLCRLAAHLTELGEDDSLWLVHRLDAGTSGVMVLARRPQAARVLSAAFAARQVEKVYLALAVGSRAGPCSVAAPIARAKGTQHAVDPAGKPALTLLRPRHTGPAVAQAWAPAQGRARCRAGRPQRGGQAADVGSRPSCPAAASGPPPGSQPAALGPQASSQRMPPPPLPGSQLVEARPRSGRTHQIRVHLAALGCPIVGDGLYGGPRRTPPGASGLGVEAVARPMLHACRLALRHPRDDAPMHWAAPLPVDFLSCAAAFGLRLPAATSVAMEP